MTLEEAKIIEEHFDSFCVQVIRNAARDYRRSLVRRIKNEVLSSELPEDFDLEWVASEDSYNLTSTSFMIPPMKRPIIVRDDDLGTAMAMLPDSLRNVVLLSYYLEMSNSTIAKILNITPAAVKKRRKKAVRVLRHLLREFEDAI